MDVTSFFFAIGLTMMMPVFAFVLMFLGQKPYKSIVFFSGCCLIAISGVVFFISTLTLEPGVIDTISIFKGLSGDDLKLATAYVKCLSYIATAVVFGIGMVLVSHVVTSSISFSETYLVIDAFERIKQILLFIVFACSSIISVAKSILGKLFEDSKRY